MLKNGSKKGFLLVKIDFAFLPTTFIVYLVLVHCRVDLKFLEHNQSLYIDAVHCRVDLKFPDGQLLGLFSQGSLPCRFKILTNRQQDVFLLLLIVK